jgi:hypothetical protein
MYVVHRSNPTAPPSDPLNFTAPMICVHAAWHVPMLNAAVSVSRVAVAQCATCGNERDPFIGLPTTWNRSSLVSSFLTPFGVRDLDPAPPSR